VAERLSLGAVEVAELSECIPGTRVRDVAMEADVDEIQMKVGKSGTSDGCLVVVNEMEGTNTRGSRASHSTPRPSKPLVDLTSSIHL
jgi:hypothetical protein